MVKIIKETDNNTQIINYKFINDQKYDSRIKKIIFNASMRSNAYIITFTEKPSFESYCNFMKILKEHNFKYSVGFAKFAYDFSIDERKFQKNYNKFFENKEMVLNRHLNSSKSKIFIDNKNIRYKVIFVLLDDAIFEFNILGKIFSGIVNSIVDNNKVKNKIIMIPFNEIIF